MGFKKFDGSSWQPITPKKLKGIPYTGTLPATLTGTKAGYLHRYKIYGNTVQTGTPTPENPIVPSECGERTENLFPESSITGKSSAVRSTFNTLAENINFQSDKQYSLRIKTNTESSAGVFRVTFTYSDDTTKKTGYITKNTSSVSLTSAAGKTVKSLSITDYNAYADITLSEITVIEGSTEPEDYIPYGYKLPLTSAGQSVDIYLGESQTTRWIRKLVLTGEESITYLSVSGLSRFAISLYTTIDYRIGLCSHYNYEYRNADGNIYHESAAGGLLCFIFDNNYSSSTAFKAYLAQQYANGTPVTIWYVLATEETGTLNEPLRKIGNYADTIDSTQTSAQIPTSSGSTTISWAGEGLAPSQFDSIQEWVDIPTYTYTNGAWVADNSN